MPPLRQTGPKQNLNAKIIIIIVMSNGNVDKLTACENENL